MVYPRMSKANINLCSYCGSKHQTTMKKITLLGVLLFASTLLATAMPNLKVALTGKIVDAQSDKPLEYATVSAFTLDSALIEGSITNEVGQFQLQLPTGNYLIKFDFLGFEPQFLTVDLKKAKDLGFVKLEADQQLLSEVEVRAKKSQMNLMIDKKVFNIGQDALARGGSANEVLESLPSVAVSVDGQVSLRGNAGVRVLINGRPSALANNNALSSIPAENIEKVEIITNPSAKYEAAGTAGIINIILKKNQSKGYGGTVSLSAGYPADHRTSANLNWRGKKYNAFLNFGTRYANFFGGSDMERRNNLAGVIDNLDQDYDMERQDRAFSIYTGLDYNLTDQSTLTASYSLYSMVNDDVYTTDYLFFTNEGETTDSWNQTLDYLEPGDYHQIDLIYTKEYDKEGRKFTAYFRNDIWAEEESENTKINQAFPSVESLLNLRTSSIETSRDHLLQADYETPLGENSKLEVGVRGETRIISADYNAEQQADEVWLPISGFNNIFDYYERIGSAYFQYRYKKEAFGIQLGLRNEYTFIKVESDEAGSGDFDKSYNQLFPSASLSYQLTEGQDLQLSYSRRIRRPQFWQLNPFRGFNDPTSLFIGNPDMDPAYTNRVELNYVQRWEKLTLNPAIYASRTSDYFEVARDQEADNIFGFESGTLLSRPINLDYEDQFGIEITLNYRPTDAITIAWDANYYGYQQRGEFGDRSFDFDFSTWTSGLRLQFDLPKDISIQAQGNYRARRKTVQILNRANYTGSFSLSKQWNDKWTLTLSTRSPIWWDSQVFRPSFVIEERGRWVGWRSMLNLQYRFEKGARASGRRNRGSIR